MSGRDSGATRCTTRAWITYEATHQNVCNHGLSVACRNRIVPRICDQCDHIAIKALLVCVVDDVVCALDVLLQRASFAAVLTADIAHCTVARPYCSFSSS